MRTPSWIGDGGRANSTALNQSMASSQMQGPVSRLLFFPPLLLREAPERTDARAGGGTADHSSGRTMAAPSRMDRSSNITMVPSSREWSRSTSSVWSTAVLCSSTRTCHRQSQSHR
jgi:hypothetical protein